MGRGQAGPVQLPLSGARAEPAGPGALLQGGWGAVRGSVPSAAGVLAPGLLPRAVGAPSRPNPGGPRKYRPQHFFSYPHHFFF